MISTAYYLIVYVKLLPIEKPSGWHKRIRFSIFKSKKIYEGDKVDLRIIERLP